MAVILFCGRQLQVLVIGSALSILTGTLHEIRQVNNERSRKRRELRIFLQTKAVPTELLMRIMSYADYKMARQSPIGYDTSLISPMLEAELATFQFGGHLAIISELFNAQALVLQTFADFCGALVKQFYSEGESVFTAGSLAEMMYITSHGDFSLGDDETHASRTFSGNHNYFAEAVKKKRSGPDGSGTSVSLYVEAVMHNCTLQAESFGEVFVLTGSKLASVLANSPMCTTMFIEYANQYIRAYSDAMSRKEHDDALEMERACASKATFTNSFYMDLNVDERKMLRSINLKELQEQEDRSTPLEFVEQVLMSNQPEFLDQLRKSFVELDTADGLHTRYGELKEQEKVESGILSLVALARGDYEAYTSPQSGANRLTMAQWEQLQGVLLWAEPTPEKVMAAIWLLAVRPMGKYRAVTSQLPSHAQRPDQAVRYILAGYPLVSPSGDALTTHVRAFVTSTLELQLDFNFAQMLQGENVPANLLQLKEFILKKSGEETLKFYVLFLLGFLSGLAGGNGSRFMNCSNARSTIPGLHILMRVLEKDPMCGGLLWKPRALLEPTALYWTYIHNRAVDLGRQPSNTADLAVVRLACLCRAQKPKDLQVLQESWQQLTSAEQRSLLQHFLADGVVNQAIVFEFLPLCLERAKSNAFVTIPVLLQVLVELLAAVRAVAPKAVASVVPRSSLNTIRDTGSKLQTLSVDLADLAAFILMVQNSYIFQTCLCRAKLRLIGGRLVLEVSQENWRRVREPHTDVIMLANSVRDLVKHHKQEKAGLQRLEEELHKAIQEVRTQVRELDGPDDKPEQIEEAATTSVDIFQQEPPAVMEQVMRDWPGTIKPEMTIRAKQHAAAKSTFHGAFYAIRVDLDLLEAQQPSWGLILLDVIILPLSLAWGFETEPMRPAVTVEDGSPARVFDYAAIEHRVPLSSPLVGVRHLRGSCGLGLNLSGAREVMAITTSFSNDTESGYLRSLRSARYLRALRSIRILRIVKSRRVNVMIENWVIGLGQQWLILAFNVCRMLASILLTAHLLVSWLPNSYRIFVWAHESDLDSPQTFIGELPALAATKWASLEISIECIFVKHGIGGVEFSRSRVSYKICALHFLSMSASRASALEAVGTAVSGFRESWIDLAEIWPEAGHVQYIHALSWVVQPPSVPESRILGSGSFEERLVSILMATGPQRMSDVLVWVVVTVLIIGSSLSILTGTLQEGLVMRIMSFADYKLERHSPAFLAGLLAESMHITSHGAFVVYDAHGEELELERYNNKHEFFSEVALYVETVMHDSTLQIESFAEVYTLSGTDVVQHRAWKLRLHSPICAGMFVEYAKELEMLLQEFVATYAKTAVHHQKSLRTTLSRNLSVASWKLDMNCAHRALKVNSFYMDLHLHKEKVLQNVRLSGSDVGADPVKPTAPEEADTLSEQMTPKRSQASKASGSEVGTMPLDGDLWHNWPLDSDLQHEAAAEKQEREEVPHLSRQLVKSIMQGQALDVEDLQEAFLELHPERGLHNMYSQQNEMEKAICSCYCLAALVADDYETYTEPQQDAAKLHRSQWEQLRSILHWAAPTEDMLEAAFFLLAVRSIGKCRAVTRQLPPESQKPEEALLAILNNYTNMVPSFERLSPSGQSMVVKSMQLQRGFSFPQMLQGENVPANLMQLRHFLDENGGAVILKFYVVFLLGFLSALQGGHGSLFMTHSNAKNIYLGLSTVQYVLEKEPGFLYWTYIYQRGTLLKRVARTSQDLAILRLACLCRARNGHDYDELQKAYHELDEHQRNVLTSHFLPSGIKSSAIVFEFLPLCLENAKKNPHVSVPGLLDVLVSLIEATWASSFSHKITTIDLSNLAGFILVLQNPFVFQTCLSRSKLRLIKDQDYQLDLTEENWNRVNEKPTDVSAVAYAVRDILHQQKQNANPFVSM
ncbi:Potassium/sodium hyperpolarization-activated cyclic nucleotide-gated channel 3 [Durusdinium trenchii]|uniref:Potassium/sodium hyperpolarization-activated cyclic nucleotide-gated channel 3 n=1 Tax=Durusdinium trenchii TaxID=1381693 RepID=A0ABP0KNP1_9DINO